MIDWDISMAEKQGYPYYMLKEIYEQPEKITDTFRGRILESEALVNLDESISLLEFEKCSRIQIVACGTSYHAGLLGKYVIEKLARIPVDVDVASEYRYRDPIIGERDGFIAISQSGETADTYACVKMARERGAKILSICNPVFHVHRMRPFIQERIRKLALLLQKPLPHSWLPLNCWQYILQDAEIRLMPKEPDYY